MSGPVEGRPSIFQRLPLPIALLIGFIMLPFGVVLLPLVPEIAIPTLLISTRLLGRRFEWARRFNGWVDQKWQAVRTRLKGDPASARPALWRWIVGAIVIVLLWQIVGSIMTVFTVISAGLTLEEFLPSGGFGATPVAPDRAALILFAILLSFVPFFLGNLIAYRYILKASVARLFSQTGRFSLRRVMFGFGLWLILGLVGVLFIELANPGVVQWVFDPVGALPYVLVALLLIPIQTTAEELFFRGWILQWSDNGRRRRSVLAAVNGVIFALPHLANPEVAGEDLIRIAGYVAVGYVWAWVTLRDRTLELAIGAHAANNISAALLVGYVGSAIPSVSLWTMERIPVAQEILFGVLGAVAFAWITGRFGKRESEVRT
jgi:membrane protease YdiL (CAAX protease family)